MANFKERLQPKTTTKVLLSAVPYVIISRLALNKMFAYTQKCSDEIGWLGTAYRNGKEIFVPDVYLFDQEVHGTTTEITPEGLATFAMDLMNQPNGVEVWNNMKLWGHSHVHMAVSPSGQDDKQMEEFKDGGHDWFLRLICNKNGELKIDLYEYTTGIIYEDIPWEVEICEAEDQYQTQIAQLEAQLKLLQEQLAMEHTLGIEDEMKVKVRKKSSVVRINGKVQSTTHGTSTTQNSTKPKGVSAISDDVKKNTLGIENYFDRDDEVLDTFSWGELREIAQEFNTKMVEELLWHYGWYDCFTAKDIERVYRVAKREVYHLGGGM